MSVLLNVYWTKKGSCVIRFLQFAKTTDMQIFKIKQKQSIQNKYTQFQIVHRASAGFQNWTQRTICKARSARYVKQVCGFHVIFTSTKFDWLHAMCCQNYAKATYTYGVLHSVYYGLNLCHLPFAFIMQQLHAECFGWKHQGIKKYTLHIFGIFFLLQIF